MTAYSAPWEPLAPLQAISRLRHGFVLRVPGLEIDTTDKDEALRRLRPYHDAALKEIGMEGWPFVSAEQIHGAEVAVVTSGEALSKRTCLEGVDALMTRQQGVAMAIYVADCAAVYLVDPVRMAVGLVHSGRRGTELEITSRAIARMQAEFRSVPGDLVAVISPCIRPPAYEVDFAARIQEQCLEAGIPGASIHDCGVCTSRHLERHYSYRMEKGRTGRMLAVLGWAP